MISKLPESKGITIGIEVSGNISSEEEANWIKIFDTHIETHGEFNLLVLLNGPVNIEENAIYNDLKWTLKNIKNMKKIAIVSDSRVLNTLVAMDSPFAKLVGIDEKHFEKNKIQDAWLWIGQ